ncbi:hypothetical protein ABH935_010023 [Catenulispora sp. GAS73]|uniref:hypothetical protein n=1 Tax=Catenulispora sp. GAS73 TaxID=3156269 RepID=UPI003513C810
MKKQWETFVGLVFLGGLVALVANFVHIPGRTVLNVGLGTVSLYWLLIITTVPWNLYFKARRVRHEIGVSRERGITVPEGREAEVRRWERRLLRLALAGHVVTAAVVAGLTYASGHVLGYYFAAFYLLSCAIRPVAAYLSYVKARITSLLKETTHPRDDVLELTTRLANLTATVEALHDAAHEAQEHTSRELDDVRNDLRAADLRLREDIRLSREAAEADRAGLRTRVEEAERRVAAVTRHFDQAVDGLTEQRELVSGIRAFVRLVRADAAAAGE